MIELRWLHKNVPIHDAFDGVQNLYPVKVLQYRTCDSDGRPLPEGFDYNWSDWQDVPEVQDE